MSFDNIDEINIYSNGDGSYTLEVHMSTTTNERVTLTMPRAGLDISLTSSFEGTSMKLILEGMIK